MTTRTLTKTRADIVTTARKYLGRPLLHQGRGVGEKDALDCVGLVLAVAEDLGLLDIHGAPIRRADYGHYGPQPVNGAVEEECARRLVLAADGGLTADFGIAAKRAILRPGDVITLRVPTIACHVAIVGALGEELTMIHAYSGNRKVVEHRIDDAWLRRIAGIFSFPGID